jgi:hypothetical protein
MEIIRTSSAQEAGLEVNGNFPAELREGLITTVCPGSSRSIPPASSTTRRIASPVLDGSADSAIAAVLLVSAPL